MRRLPAARRNTSPFRRRVDPVSLRAPAAQRRQLLRLPSCCQRLGSIRRPPGRQRLVTGVLAVSLACLGAAGIGLAAPAAGAATVVVQPGDTLWGLALQTHATVAELAALNHLRDPSLILPGERLTVPPLGPAPRARVGEARHGLQARRTHHASHAPSRRAAPRARHTASTPPGPLVEVTVAPGETLWAIASAHHSTVAALTALNHLEHPNLLLAGTHLLVPAAPRDAGSATARSVGVRPGPARRRSPDAPKGVTKGSAPPPATSAAMPPLSAYGIPPQPPAPAPTPSPTLLVPVFTYWAAVWGVPAPLLEAIAWHESRWEYWVESPTEAIGIGQLEPYTVTYVEADLLHGARLDPWVPSNNIEMSAVLLRSLLDATGWNVPKALEAYADGLGAVEANRLAPGTRQYVAAVLAYERQLETDPATLLG